jgi:Ca-activated chloride channel family protein
MNFAWPWCFLLLPLPWLLRRWLAPVEVGTALRLPQVPFELDIASARRPTASLWLASLAWLLLVGASARPQMPDESGVPPVSGRNLMLAFDVSNSMATQDLRQGNVVMGRLQVARTLVDAFLKRRQGDRVGLIVFGTQAYLHTPLTFDLEAVRAALATMEPGFAGPETALGDAIGLATKYLTPLAQGDRELVLLTDGANSAGTLAPGRAAWLAQRAGVRIHAIGIGATADLDEATLRQIAEQTGGSYQRGIDPAAIEAFFSRLEQLAPTTVGPVADRPQRALYPWPAGLALLLTLWLALRHKRVGG